MPGFGMQGFGMGGDWRMAPFNGFGGGGFAPMQPSQGMMRPSTGGGGFAPMPGGMSSDDDSFGAFPGGPLTGLNPNDGLPGAVPGFGGRPSMGGIPGVGPGLQGPRPGGVSPIGPGLQGPGGMPGSGMQRPGGMMSPGGPPAAMPGSGRNNPWAGDSIGDTPYWQKPAAPASGQGPSGAGGQGLFGPQSNFQMNTRGFDGQNYANQGDYWNKVGAFVDTINQDRARLSGQSGQQMGPPPQRDFAGMWQQAGDKVQGGWQNPFAQQQPSVPQGGWQQATPGYGTDPSKRDGIRDASFRDKDGDRIDDRDQDGPGMPAYGRNQGGQNSGYVRPQGGQAAGSPYSDAVLPRWPGKPPQGRAPDGSPYSDAVLPWMPSKTVPQGGNQLGGDRWFAGGTPYFDERTGQRTQPPSGGSGRPAQGGGAYSAYSGGQSYNPADGGMDFGNKTMNVQPGGAYDQKNPTKWVDDWRKSKSSGQQEPKVWFPAGGGQSAYNRIASSAPQSMYRR